MTSLWTLQEHRQEDYTAAEVVVREVDGDLPSSTLARWLLEGRDKVSTYLKSEEGDDLVVLSNGMLKQGDDHRTQIFGGDGSRAHCSFHTTGVRVLVTA